MTGDVQRYPTHVAGDKGGEAVTRDERIRVAEQRIIEAAEDLGHDQQTCGCDICEAVLAFQVLTGLPTKRGRAALARFEREERAR